MSGALVLLLVIALVLMNVPIAVSLGIAAVVAMVATRAWRACRTCRSRSTRAPPASR